MVLHELGEAIDLTQAAGQTAGLEVLLESFNRLRGLLAREDRGWVRLFGQDEGVEFGLTLDDLKDWGRKIRESVPGAPWIGRGFRTRANFIWKDGIQYGNIPEPKQGLVNLRDIINRPGNQFHFFAPSARRKTEHRLYTEGIAFWIGNEKSKDLESIPLRQITSQFIDPDGLGTAWAYLREWTHRNPRTGKSTQYKRWYFTDQFKAMRVPYIGAADGQRIPVDQNHVIFDQHANHTDGFVYGTPDALAAFIWNGIVRDAYMDGRTMTQAMARFALKATASTKQGAENAALQYANADTAGSLAVVGGAGDLRLMDGAGKGYDFTSLGPLLAVVAASLDISKVALAADSGDGSYAGISSLDLPTRLAMNARRDEHIELNQRVLRWMGPSSFEPDVQFKPFDGGEEAYRIIQGFMLGVQNDLYGLQEARNFVDNVLGLPNGTIPTGDDRPSILLAQAAQATAAAKAASSATPQTASPNQGKSNGTGGQQGGNASSDLRSDTISK